jgi:hypothetical protein
MCLWVSGLTMMAASPAHGQTDPSANAVFQMGPLAFTPSLSVPSFGIDSNVFNESENPKSDFTSNVQPEIEAWLRIGRARLGVKEQISFLYFDKYASERAVNNSTSLRFDVLLLNITPHATVSVIKTNDRPDPTIDTRARHVSTPVTAGVDIRLSAKTNIDLGADYDRVTFDDKATFEGVRLKSELDRNTRGYHAALRFAVTPPTALILTVLREEELFRFSPGRNTTSVRVVPGISFSSDAVITGQAEVGWLSFNPRDTTIRPFKGLVVRADLGYVLLGLTRFQLLVSRDVMPAIDSLEAYFIQNSVTGTITHRISERWDVNVSGSRLHLDFGNGRVLPATVIAIDRGDLIHTYGAGVGFYFNQGLRLGVRAESVSRDSVLPIGRYDNMRIMSSVNYGFK